MSALVDVLAVLAMLATLGVTAMVLSVLLRGSWQSVQRLPTGRRRQAAIRGALGFAVVAVSLAAVIAEPFGRPTILVVVAGYMAVIVGALAWAIGADLRARRPRRQRD